MITFQKTNLSVIQWNIRGLVNKQSGLKEVLLSFPCSPDIVLLCETWLTKDKENRIDLPGYKWFSKNRTDKIGGGVCIMVSSKL